jgi:tRNA 2-thiouridine synthesizing protein A
VTVEETRQAGAEEAPAKVLDARGLKCPMPVLRTKKAVDELSVGQVLEVVATDPGSMADFRAWTKNTGHELILAEQQGDVFRYRIRKTK